MLSCPLCESEQIRRSRRHGILERKILPVLFVRPFRCLRCDLRFFRWTLSANTQESRPATAR
jgi:hypothetical protein